MKHLLDVNLLLAAIWSNHSKHAENIVVCALSELGFIRISTNKKAINAPMDKARELLEVFIRERGAESIPDDLPTLKSHPQTSDHVTDHYLADLAANHSMKLATLDKGITHAAVVTVN